VSGVETVVAVESVVEVESVGVVLAASGSSDSVMAPVEKVSVRSPPQDATKATTTPNETVFRKPIEHLRFDYFEE
jgi:hypothetical protein